MYGIVTGVLAGAVGAFFQLCIDWFSQGTAFVFAAFRDYIWMLCIFSIVLSTGFLVLSLYIVKRFAPEASGSGVQEIKGILENTRQMCWWRILPTKFVGGVLSLSSGLVLGREGPTIQMGGAIGQFVKNLFV